MEKICFSLSPRCHLKLLLWVKKFLITLRWGSRTEQHSTNPFPYNKQLARKKKFLKNSKIREKNIELGNPNIGVAQVYNSGTKIDGS